MFEFWERTREKNCFKWLLCSVLSVPGLLLGKSDASVHVNGVDVSGSNVAIQARVTQVPETAPTFLLKGNLEGEKYTLNKEKLQALNLWVLVDTSTLCSAFGIDDLVSGLVQRLKKTLPEESLLSLVTYAKSNLEVLHNHRPLKKVETSAIRCEDKLLSTGYEKPLLRLFESEEANKSAFPKVVWVYSSGNIKVSKKVLNRLKASGSTLRVLLYNPFVEKEIRPIFSGTQRLLGSRTSFEVLTEEKKRRIPELYYVLPFSPPADVRGKRFEARLSVQMGKEEFLSAPFSVNAPNVGVQKFWSLYGKYFVGVGLFLLFAYGVWRIFRFYRPKYCKCGDRLRRNFPLCLKCLDGGKAFLVGNFNLEDPRKKGKTDVLALNESSTELGTHRRSAIRMLTDETGKKHRFASIWSEKTAEGALIYYIDRLVSKEMVDILVNGTVLNGRRHLSSGDQIKVDGVPMTFYFVKERGQYEVA